MTALAIFTDHGASPTLGLSTAVRSWQAFRRSKAPGVIAGLVPAISIRIARRSTIGMAGTSPAMTKQEPRQLFPAEPAPGRFSTPAPPLTSLDVPATDRDGSCRW